MKYRKGENIKLRTLFFLLYTFYYAMCGGVGFRIKNIPEEELRKYYSPELVERFMAGGRVESFFWHEQPMLPYKTKDGIKLGLWGNKDANVKLPKTGWAKSESLSAGRWDYLHPEPVDIPVDSGYEKRTWFDLPEGTKGIVVKPRAENGGPRPEERVYMITQEASEEYKNETGHGREPLGKKRNYEHV